MRREDAEAIGRLYDEYVWSVYGFFGYRVRSKAEAEDLTQATFENVVRSWHLFDRRRGREGTWLMAVARNILIDHYRRDRGSSQEPLTEGVAESERVATVDAPALGLSPELEAALARLTDNQREVIALRFGADLNGPDIAAVTGLTTANVHQILSRALRQLRDDLGAAGAESHLRAETGP